jgi:hypothetical protein
MALRRSRVRVPPGPPKGTHSEQSGWVFCCRGAGDDDASKVFSRNNISVSGHRRRRRGDDDALKVFLQNNWSCSGWRPGVLTGAIAIDGHSFDRKSRCPGARRRTAGPHERPGAGRGAPTRRATRGPTRRATRGQTQRPLDRPARRPTRGLTGRATRGPGRVEGARRAVGVD